MRRKILISVVVAVVLLSGATNAQVSEREFGLLAPELKKMDWEALEDAILIREVEAEKGVKDIWGCAALVKETFAAIDAAAKARGNLGSAILRPLNYCAARFFPISDKAHCQVSLPAYDRLSNIFSPKVRGRYREYLRNRCAQVEK